MDTDRAIVVIMAHTSKPTAAEAASFDQCLRVLGRHAIAIVCPKSLDAGYYLKRCDDAQVEPDVQRFEDKWFRSVNTYNKFMLQPDFYRRFAKYEYMLVYQLDAWVFNDELENWCEKKYLYVGAPFFNDRGERFPFAGNGGFSLRHIRSFIAVLEDSYTPAQWNYDFMFVRIPARTVLRGMVKRLIHISEMTLCRISTKWYCAMCHEHEDFIFAKVFSLLGRNNVPLPQEAALFAYERSPEGLFEETGHRLPFGCHAYEKYGRNFWRTWISP